MNFEKLLTSSAPVNGTAARVIQRGKGFEVKRKPAQAECWDTPPKAPMEMPKEAPDYSGFRRGYMTAVRYHTSSKDGSKWLVRCDCGKYELRRAARWVKAPEVEDACMDCRATHFIKTGRTLGDNRTERERRMGLKGGE